jgi:hypothetical protein
LERWLIEVGLAFWQALKNVDHRKNPSPKVSLSKNSSPTITWTCLALERITLVGTC